MKDILMSIGISGLGKSTFLKQQVAGKPHIYICPDDIREELTGDASDQSRNWQVWKLTYDRFEKALRADSPESRTIVLDATFLNRKSREKVLNILRKRQAGDRLWIYEFPVNPQLAVERQKQRERQVPEHVIYQQAAKYEPLSTQETQGLDVRHVHLDEALRVIA
jgi:predicted kinase